MRTGSVKKLKPCQSCGEFIKPKFGLYEYSRRRFCSVSCARKDQFPVPYFDCDQCGENVSRSKTLKKNGSSYNYKQKYCSKECHNESLKKGGYLDKHGYRIVHYKGLAIPEHRQVMESVIGRSLYKHETVHHKNGNRSDNRIENLELWSSRHGKGQRIEDKIVHAREILDFYAVPSSVLTMSEAISGMMGFAA